jgi:Flp pilus assembly protein TadB
MDGVKWLMDQLHQYGSWIAKIGGWIVAAYAWMRKRRAEVRYRDIERRAEAPYLVAASFSAHAIADHVRYLDMSKAAERLEEFSESLGSHGLEMHLGFINEGQRVRAVSVVEPSPISLVKVGAVIAEGPSPGWIRYVYEHARKGRVERFSLKFESFGGFKQVHVYETIHGKGSLRRVDPA